MMQFLAEITISHTPTLSKPLSCSPYECRDKVKHMDKKKRICQCINKQINRRANEDMEYHEMLSYSHKW